METRLARARKNVLAHSRWDFTHIAIRSLDALVGYEERSRKVEHDRPDEQTCILEVQLYDRQQQPVPVRRLSNLLLQTPSIDTLRIDLQPLSKFKGNRIFQGITLPHLRILSCSGIPHSTLADFISRHPDLRTISTGRCSERTCAFSTLSTELKLSSITGPSSCIHGLVSGETAQVFVTCQDPNALTVNKDDALFAQLKAVQAPTYSFSTQFFPEDFEFTRRLSDAMPEIAILKLKEAPIRTEDQAVSYPWNCTSVWNDGIHRMDHLKRLDVQTISPPVVGMRPGEPLAELGLIEMWLGGGRLANLTEVNLRYASEGVLYLSTWVSIRGSGAWMQENHSEI